MRSIEAPWEGLEEELVSRVSPRTLMTLGMPDSDLNLASFYLQACMIFIFIIYVLLLAWLVVFACCIIMTVFYTVSWGVCNTDEIQWNEGLIDFYPYHFLFPKGFRQQTLFLPGSARNDDLKFGQF